MGVTFAALPPPAPVDELRALLDDVAIAEDDEAAEGGHPAGGVQHAVPPEADASVGDLGGGEKHSRTKTQLCNRIGEHL